MEGENVLRRLNDDLSTSESTSALRAPAELLDFKFRIMKRKGFKMIDPPLMCASTIHKSVEVDNDGAEAD